MSQPNPSELYEQRQELHEGQANALTKRGQLIGNLRGVSFATFAIGVAVGLYEQSWIPGGVGALGLAAFFVLIRHHDKILESERAERRLALVNTRALGRLLGDDTKCPRLGSDVAPEAHPYAVDLDLFGPGSLYQRLSVAHTAYGRVELASWLKKPATLAEIHSRQAAVTELAPALDLRQHFEADALALLEKRPGEPNPSGNGPDPKALLSWVKSASDLPHRSLVTLLSFVLPVLTLAGMVGHSLGALSPLYWVISLALSLATLNAAREVTGETFGAVSTGEGAFLRYADLFRQMEGYQASSPWVLERQQALKDHAGNKPSQVIRRFTKLVSWYELRHSGMVYPFINAIFLWDIHCTRTLLNWKKDVSGDLDAWFLALGQFEAISSLAGFLHDEPDACLPQVHEDPKGKLVAHGLGHPLIEKTKRIKNDVAPFKAGEALLITGSNMSGKSTFLRSIGINAVLAFAGSAVTAKSFSLPLCRLGTSIRVSDSLSRGVSHFYAEIEKLAYVVSEAREHPPVLFLLDEVLHGTNSRERQIGARWSVAELLKAEGLGVVTTHDMELCQLSEELMHHVRQHHFREDVKKNAAGIEEMTFDYQLKDGPVTSGNALRLMRRVGLDVPLDEPN